MIRSIRVLGAAFGVLVALMIVAADNRLFERTGYPALFISIWTIAWLVVGFGVVPYLTILPARWLVREVHEMSTAEFVAAVLGLLLGLLMGLLLGLPLGNLPEPYGRWLPLGVSVVLSLGMVGFTVAKRSDLIEAAQAAGLFRQPEAAPRPSSASAQIVVDTSAIIDGRIADIVDAGFLYGTLIIPRFVLDELQRIADSADAQRRSRGRRGLEILGRLQKDGLTPVEIVADEARDVGEVDAKLVAMARLRGAAILTNDFNLNRVADLQSIRVLNVNSLANAMKPALLPGDSLRIRLISEGKEPGQGVGYLDDGTMVVVEGGARFVDRELEVQVTRVLQTVMGRMIFAQLRLEGAATGRREEA